MDVFSRRNAAELAGNAGDGLLAEMRQGLLDGRTIDVVHYSQRLVGRSIARAIGVGAQNESTYSEVASLASSITSMLGLDKLKPTQEDVEKASVYYRKLLVLAREKIRPG